MTALGEHGDFTGLAAALLDAETARRREAVADIDANAIPSEQLLGARGVIDR